MAPGFQLREEMAVFLTNLSGASHTRQRRLISAGFTPRMIGRLEQNLREWSRKIFDDALERESVDCVDDVAYQLPMHLIADVMGIPLEDRAWPFTRANTFLQFQEPARSSFTMQARKGQPWGLRSTKRVSGEPGAIQLRSGACRLAAGSKSPGAAAS